MSAPKSPLPNKPLAADRVRSADLPVAWIMMLGLIVAVGPLSIDMYLPALPSMADDFGVSTAFMANSVPAYFVGLVFGQLFYGPFSDRVGRVKPLYIGMVFIQHTTPAQFVMLEPYYEALLTALNNLQTHDLSAYKQLNYHRLSENDMNWKMI